MSVQQGKLRSVNTDINFEKINSDLETPASRIFHNGTDLIKCEFQTIRPDFAFHFLTQTPSGSSPYNGPYSDSVSVPSYVDSDFSSGAGGAGGYHLAVQYPTTIKTQQLKVFSTSFFGNFNNGESVFAVSKDFGTVASQASLLPVSVLNSSFTFRSDLSPQQFEYTINLSSEEEGRSWFITALDATSSNSIIFLDGVTEVIVKPLPQAQIAYFRLDGEQASRFSMAQSDLLDMTYDKVTDKYYTIRFNDTGLGGTDIGPDEDFSTPSGSTSFNPVRWTEDPGTFIRSISNNRLVFSTTNGAGKLSSNYVVEGDFEAELSFDISSLNSETSFFDIRSVDSSTQRLKYAVGVGYLGEDIYYKSAITSFVNNTTSADLLSLAPELPTVYSGSEDWTVTFVSASGHWTVEGEHTGSRPPALTGELYSSSGISFQISANSVQNNNDSFTFTLDYEVKSRGASTGTLDITRSGSTYISLLDGGWSEAINSSDDRLQIYGTTSASINMFADNFSLEPDGSAVYPSIPVFTIEEVDEEGQVVQAVVENFNVIKDPTKSYNDYIDGGVMLAVKPTKIYVKVLNDIYSFSQASPIAGQVDENTSGVERSQDVIESNGIYSFFYNDTSGGFLSYIFYDEDTEELQVKTLTSTDTPVPQGRKIFINVPDWNEQSLRGTPYQFYWLSDDNTSLFYLRRHGTGKVNEVKVTGTAGVANGTDVFTDSTKDFEAAGVKLGDLVVINESAYSSNGTYTIVEIPTPTSLRLKQRDDSDTTLEVKTSVDYQIASNAELLTFNTDPDQSAFAAVNVDDFTLRAGTSDTSGITAEVINAWGEPLPGKTVNFSVIQGDGAVSPPSDTTDGSGEANTQYTAGSTPGAVIVKASITEV